MEERYLTDFLFISESELKSYSDSFESRARDRFVAFLKDLFELGSCVEYRTMFHSDKIVINKRNRRLLDYIDVSALIDRVEIISLNQEFTQRLIEIIKTEKGFETVQYDQANSRVTIPLPPLTMNQMLELSDAIIAKEKQIERNLFSVKAQTGQQIRKGIENEYIDNIDAAKVSKEIDQIVEHYLHVGKLFSIAKREMVMGSFKPKTPEDAELYEQIGPARDVLLGKTMEQPASESEPEDMTMVE